MIRFLNMVAAANFVPQGNGMVRLMLPRPLGGSILMGEVEAEGAKALWQSIFLCFAIAGHACALIVLVVPLLGCGLLLAVFVLWICVIWSIQGEYEPAADEEREQRDWVSLQRSKSLSRRQVFWLHKAAWLTFVLSLLSAIYLPSENAFGFGIENLIGLFVVSMAWLGFFDRIRSSPKAKEHWARTEGFMTRQWPRPKQ